MAAKKRQSPKWSVARKKLMKWEVPELVDLVKDLCGQSPDNRDFLHTRLAANPDDEAVLLPYRERITDEFYPLHGYGEARVSVARKAIRDYRKASGNMAGTAELMLTYVEIGSRFAHDFHVNDERFYDSLVSVLGELVALLDGEPPELYLRFRERLLAVENKAARMGWGYGDRVAHLMAALEANFET